MLCKVSFTRKMGLVFCGRLVAVLLAATVVLRTDDVRGSVEPPSISITADRDKVGVGETVEITIQVSSEGVKPEKISLPSFEGFEVVGRSVSSPVQFSFGLGTGVKMTYTSVYDLTLQAKEPGSHRIGPVVVRVGGKEYQSESIVVVVTREPQGGGRGGGRGGRDHAPGWPWMTDPFKHFDDLWKRHFDPFVRPQPQPFAQPESQKDPEVPPAPPPEGLSGANYDPELFLRTVVSPQKVFVGQQATLELFLYSRLGNITNIDVTREPGTEKFWIKDILPSRRDIEFIPVEIAGGRFGVATLRKVAIFPTEAGVQEIAPAEVTVLAGLGGIVGFGGQTYRRSGVAVTIEVAPLPADGVPPGFDPANVGTYTIEARLAAKKGVVDQPLSVQFVISGTGNIEMLRPPQVEFPEGLRTYEPQITDLVEVRRDVVGGTKKIEYVVIPVKAGPVTIPSVKFSFFDPTVGQYRTVQSEPIELMIEPASSSTAQESGVKGVGGDHRVTEEEEKGLVGLRPILTVASLQPASSQFILAKWFIPAIALPPALMVLFLLARLVRVGVARLRRKTPASVAFGQARKALRKSLSHGGADKEKFYSLLQKIIYQYLEMKLSLPVSGMTSAEIKKVLLEVGIGDSQVDGLIWELENCEFARYGRMMDGGEDIKVAARRVEEKLEGLERQFGKNGRNEGGIDGRRKKGGGDFWVRETAADKEGKVVRTSTGSAVASMLLVGAVLLFAAAARGNNVKVIFDEANEAYFKGNYQEAIKKYYSIIGLGIEDPAVYFNTANAFAKLGEYGKAIFFYHKVLKIKPRDSATQKNLSIVRAKLGRQLSDRDREISIRPRETVWEGVASWFTANELVVLFLVFYYAFFVAILVRWFLKRPVARIAVTITIVFFVILWVLAGALALLKYDVDFLRREGIVVERGLVAVREGPAEESAKVFDLVEGQRVKIREERGAWLRIEEENGKVGWLRRPQIGIL